MVAVELQLRSDLLFPLLHGQTNGVQNQIHRLFRSGFVGHNAVVIEVPDHGQVQYALLGVDVRDVRYPFAVGLVCVKVPVQQILVLVYLLPHLLPFPASADFRQQVILLHNSQYSFGIAENILGFQPQPHPPITVGVRIAFPLLCDELSKSCILLRLAKAMGKGIVSASGYSEEFAHDCYGIFCFVTIDDMIDRRYDTLPLSSLPSCEAQKIPQQFIFHAKPLDLIGLLCHKVSWRIIFSRVPLGTRYDACLQLAFLCSLSFE